MAIVLKCLLCLQAWLALRASAARDALMLEDRDAVDNREPELKSLLQNAPEAICGGDNIWDLVTGSRSLDSIQNIRWEKIQKTGEDFIDGQKQEVESLELELKLLAEQIEEKQKQAALQDASSDQVQEMITKALANATSFNDVETAQRTLCGVPMIQPRAPKGAYKQSQVVFSATAQAFFDEGKYVLEGDTFGTVCEEMLSCGGEQDCYCGPLCQKFRDIAQAISDERVGARSDREVDTLLQKQSTKQSDLNHHKLQLAQCEEDLTSISNFGEQIKALKKDMQDKEDKVMDAEWALADAMYDLEVLDDTLSSEEKNTEDLLETVQEAGAEFKEVSDAFVKVKKDEEALREAKEASITALEEARKKLDAAKTAEAAVTKLKMAVRAIVQAMSEFFKFAVQTPVEFIGFEADLDVFDFFNKDPWDSTLKGVTVVQDSISALHDVCNSDETRLQFEEVAKKIDLSPLCAFEEPDAVEEDVRPAVTDAWNMATDEVRDVISWLQPFKGQPELTEEKRKEYEAAGEPHAFREVAGIYHDASFFNYLKDWKAGGPFLELIAKLLARVSDLDASVQKLVAEQEEMQEKLEQLLAAREAAKIALAEAQKKSSAADGQKQVMEQKMQTLEDDSRKLQEQADELRAKLEEAKRLHQRATETLMASHEKATSMLQAYQALGREEEDAKEVLRVRRAETQGRVKRLERLLTAARRYERASAARLHSL